MALCLPWRYIVHAVLEEYLLNGSYGGETFNTIFAFGSPGAEHRADEGSDGGAMRSIFCSDARPHEELPAWSAIKRRYVQEVST